MWCRVVSCGVALRGEAGRRSGRLGGPEAGRVIPSGQVIIQQVVLWVVGRFVYGTRRWAWPGCRVEVKWGGVGLGQGRVSWGAVGWNGVVFAAGDKRLSMKT